MLLTEKAKEYIATTRNGSTIIGNEKYYFKATMPGFSKTEVIAQDLAEVLEIYCLKYATLSIGSNTYYISKDLNKEGTFLLLSELGIHKYSLYDSWHILEEYYGNASELVYDIIKIYLFDILFMNSDRNPENLGLIITPTGAKIIMLDNEFIFDDMSVGLSSKYSPHELLKNSKYCGWLDYPSYLQKNMEELEFFLATSSQEFTDMFWEMYKKATPEVVKNVIKKHEKGTIGRLYIEKYKQNYELIRTLKGRDSNGQRILENKRVKQLY